VFAVTVLLVALLVATGVFVVSAWARSTELSVHFITADGNIECEMADPKDTSGGIDCVMRSSGYNPTAPDETNYHPHWVLLSRGVGLKGTTRRGLGRSTPRRILQDGHTLTVGNFRCSARASHLTCISRRSGHGFFLSQGRQRTF
jgi:hypothetical protein